MSGTVRSPLLRQGALAVALTALATAAAAAQPAADSPWATDPQQTRVADRSAEPMESVNSVMCYVSSVAAGSMLGAGPYAAMIDDNLCNPDNGVQTVNTGPDYRRAVVDVTRADSASPMRGRVWVEQKFGSASVDIHANLSATESPSASNPNGVFTLDYCAPMPGGGCYLNGRLEALSNGLRFIERERVNAPDATVRLTLTRDGESGTGAVSQSWAGRAPVSFRFAYNAEVFRRVQVGGEDACFDRSMTNGNSAAWRYGVYDEAGSRVTRSGMVQISATVDGIKVPGFAGYWGVNFPPEFEGKVGDGSTVTRIEVGSDAAGASYTLARIPGKLYRNAWTTSSLSKVDGLPLYFGLWNGLSPATMTALGATLSTIQQNQPAIAWNAAERRLEVIGWRRCADGVGCQIQPVSPAVPLSADDLQIHVADGLSGWSEVTGGNVLVPAATLAALIAGSADSGALPLRLRTREIVYPGSADAPTTLHCVANCPTAAGFEAMGSGAADPYGSTANAWQNATVVAYTFGADGRLRHEGAPVLWPSTLEGGGQFANGVLTVGLATDPEALRCAQDASLYCGNGTSIETTYEWETGPRGWNQFTGLKGADGAWLHFDEPLVLNWTVPSRAEFGVHAGVMLQLVYNDFGDLWGIPSRCVDASTNEPVACGAGEAVRWIPAFTIPATLTEGRLTGRDGKAYYAKWLEREVRFGKRPDSACAALVPGALADLPELGSLRDPSSKAQPDVYIGTKPEVTAAPRVVGGVVKY